MPCLRNSTPEPLVTIFGCILIGTPVCVLKFIMRQRAIPSRTNQPRYWVDVLYGRCKQFDLASLRSLTRLGCIPCMEQGVSDHYLEVSYVDCLGLSGHIGLRCLMCGMQSMLAGGPPTPTPMDSFAHFTTCNYVGQPTQTSSLLQASQHDPVPLYLDLSPVRSSVCTSVSTSCNPLRAFSLGVIARYSSSAAVLPKELLIWNPSNVCWRMGPIRCMLSHESAVEVGKLP